MSDLAATSTVNTGESNDMVVLGKLGSAYGIKGWLKVYSYTDPMENLLNYKQFSISKSGQWSPIVIDTGRRHGKGLIVHLVGCDDRDKAAEFVNCEIAIPKSLLPKLEAGEYYWHQLVGLSVTTTTEYGAKLLGKVDHLIETGANDVLVVKPSEGSIDSQERLIPYVPEQYVTNIDLATGSIEVSWDPEF